MQKPAQPIQPQKPVKMIAIIVNALIMPITPASIGAELLRIA